MIITEESVNYSQLDELTTRLFKVKGKINLDKYDLSYVLARNDDSKLITFRREDEESKEFMTKLTSYMASRPDVKKLKRIMLYFGYSPEHPLRMEDLGIFNEFLNQFPEELDILWGIHENPDEIGLSAVAVYSIEQ